MMNKFYILYTELEYEGCDEPKVYYSIEELIEKGHADAQMCDTVYVKTIDIKTQRETKHHLNRGYTGVSQIKWEQFIQKNIR